MPEAFEAPEDGEIFRQAIEAVNEAAKRAEDAGKEAVSSAGEAREADIGIAGGIGEGLLIKKGEILRKVPEAELLEALRAELMAMAEERRK